MVDRSGIGKRPAAILGGAAVAVFLGGAVAAASTLDDIGVTSLRSLYPTLTGAGITVGQVEATDYSGPSGQPYDPTYDANNFEFDPTGTGPNGTAPIIFSGTVPGLTWVGKIGTTPSTTYDSTLWKEHPQDVAANFYGTSTGVATGINASVIYNANFFYSDVIDKNATVGTNIAANPVAIQMPLAPAGALPVSVVNQSFIFDGLTTGQANFTNQLYDNYVVTHGPTLTNQGVIVPGVIFVSGVGNGGGPQVPATAYNVIAVGAYGGASSVGPTSDGRSKPDIVAPASATSYSTPYVSGVATLLVQAGAAGYGGSSPATELAAVDGRTIKALLLNGATKPAGWTHTTTQPLDLTYGAGIVNAYNSVLNLAAGQKTRTALNTSQTPLSGTSIGTAGWDFQNTLPIGDVAHYSLDLSAANGPSTFTSTLVWWRPSGGVTTDSNGYINSLSLTTINNLDLKLYNLTTGAIVDQSVSTVDNVEQIYLTNLAAGKYDLEVINGGGGSEPQTPYAMAFNLTGGAITLNVTGTYDMHGASQSVGTFTGTGTLTNSVASINTTLTVVGSSQFDGVIEDGAAQMSLVKSTTGVLTLTGANTYSGPTSLTGGTLLANNNTGSATGTSWVYLNGGTLGGHGTITGRVVPGSGPHTIAPSATLSPSSTGTLRIGTLYTNANTTLAFNLVTPNTAGGSDLIYVTDWHSLNLNGGTIQVANTTTGAASLGYYRIIQYFSAFNGSLSSLTLPPTSNNIAYVLDTQHDPGYIDLHRGLLGDANDDGTVNFADFAILSNNFGLTGVGWSGGDFNGDGIVNAADFQLLSADFNGTINPAWFVGTALASYLDSTTTTVPEPASLLILNVGIVGLLARRRRTRPYPCRTTA